MIGKRYWSTGISISYSGDRHPGWGGEVDFLDDGFCNDEPERGLVSTQGWLRTHYYVPSRGGHRDALTAVTDTLTQDAERMGIEFRDPYIYAKGDGEDPDHPMPEGWVDLLEEQAERLGWETPPYRRSRPDGSRRPRLRVLD